MKHVLSATFVAATLAVTLSAQDPQSAAQQKSSDQKKKDDTVTLTGCVREGDQPGTFILENATEETRGTSGVTPATPATPSSRSSAEKSSYRLIASSDVDLKTHVGHKIQVTGTVAAAASSKEPEPSPSTPPSATPPTTPPTTPPSATPPSTPSPTGTSGMEEQANKNLKRLNVKSVKMVSDSCM